MFYIHIYYQGYICFNQGCKFSTDIYVCDILFFFIFFVLVVFSWHGCVSIGNMGEKWTHTHTSTQRAESEIWQLPISIMSMFLDVEAYRALTCTSHPSWMACLPAGQCVDDREWYSVGSPTKGARELCQFSKRGTENERRSYSISAEKQVLSETDI